MKIETAEKTWASTSDRQELERAQRIAQVCKDYVCHLTAGDVAALVNLYAPEATLHDPIGTAEYRGHEAIRGFYQGGLDYCLGDIKARLEAAVRVRGLDAAFALVVRADRVAEPFETQSIDLIRFNEQLKIVSMTAYWGEINKIKL